MATYPLTRLRVHPVLVAGLFQVRQSSLEGIIRAQDIDIHHRLEGIGRQLLNGGQEVTRRARTARLA